MRLQSLTNVVLMLAIPLHLAATAARAGEGAVELVSLQVPDGLKAGVPYTVTLPYVAAEGADVRLVSACFSWSGEGPYCFNLRDDRANAKFTVRLKTGNPNTYVLAGFVKYEADGKDGQSNTVSATIHVKP